LPHDVLYLNSVFSITFTLVPLLLRRAGLLPCKGLVLAPRGELDPEALGIKRQRKRIYLWVLRTFGLLGGAVWHATSAHEEERIRTEFGDALPLVRAASMPVSLPPSRRAAKKTAGSLAIVFVGRVSRMKNLHVAIEALRRVRGVVRFDIFGPMEDGRYWQECEKAAQDLPPDARVQYRGVIHPDEVGMVLANHHLFFSPTLGENFGHAIVESMLVGRPVLISDRTPWHHLEARLAGWEVPLSDVADFTRVIQRCVDMDQTELERWSAGARRFGNEIASDPAVLGSYVRLFRQA
jgi:glycosyltransferase involved in cell wall biosynthesis